jgi:hypothetical protein
MSNKLPKLNSQTIKIQLYGRYSYSCLLLCFSPSSKDTNILRLERYALRSMRVIFVRVSRSETLTKITCPNLSA